MLAAVTLELTKHRGTYINLGQCSCISCRSDLCVQAGETPVFMQERPLCSCRRDSRVQAGGIPAFMQGETCVHAGETPVFMQERPLCSCRRDPCVHAGETPVFMQESGYIILFLILTVYNHYICSYNIFQEFFISNANT